MKTIRKNIVEKVENQIREECKEFGPVLAFENITDQLRAKIALAISMNDEIDMHIENCLAEPRNL